MEQVIVAGAGIVGVSTAIWLQRAGYKVTLVDRQGPASGTSHGNAGVLAASGLTPVTMPGLVKKAPFMLLDKFSPLFLRAGYFPRLLPFLAEYLGKCNYEDVRLYAKGMAPLVHDTVSQHRALAKGTGAEQFIEDTDYCFGYADNQDFLADAIAWDLRREWNVDFDVMAGKAYGKIDPIYDGKFATVVRCSQHGRISDPGAYVQALAKHFEAEGGQLELATVIDLRQDSSGRAILITDKGEMGADKIALTTGVWSKPLLQKFGIRVPMESERGYHIELVNPELYPKNSMMVVGGKFAVTPMNGRIRCAGVVEFAGLEAGKREAPLKMLSHHIQSLFSELNYDSQIDWLGHRPALVDSLPMIGSITGNENLFTAFGHQHLGLTGGAKTGRIVSELISQDGSSVDVSPYHTNRFN